MYDGLAKDAPGLDVGWKMFADQDAVPTNVPADLENGLPATREEFGQDHGVNCSTSRMAAGISETGLRLAQRQLGIQLVWALAFPVIFRRVNNHADLFFDLFKERGCARKIGLDEDRTDGRLEQRKRKTRIFHGALFFGSGSGFEYSSGFLQVSDFFGGARGRRWGQERDGIGVSRGQIRLGGE